MMSSVLAVIAILAALVAATALTLQFLDRARLKRSLKQLESEFLLTEQVARVGYWRRGIDDQVATWSPGIYEILGERPESFVPTQANARAFYSADDLLRLNAMLEPTPDGSGREEEFQIHLRDGSTKDVAVSVRYQFNRRGKFVGVFGVMADISARKRAQREIKERETRLDLALEATGAVTWDIDFINHTVRYSPRWRQVTGYDRTEYTRAEQTPLFHPDDIDRMYRAVSLASKQREPWSVEFRLRHKSGHFIWLHSRGLVVTYDAEGQIGRAVGTLTDISERRASTERMAHTARDAHLLHAVTLLAINSTSFDDIIKRTIDLVCEATNWTLGHAFIVLRPDATELSTSDIWRDHDEKRYAVLRRINEGLTFRPGAGLPGEVWLTRKPTWVEDIHHDPRFTHLQAPELKNLRAAAAFPIVVGDEVRAVLEFFADAPVPPDADLLRVFETLGLQLGTFIKRFEDNEEFQRNRESLALAIEASQAGHFDLDLVNRKFYWSPRAREILGIADDSQLPDIVALPKLVHQEDAPEFLAEVEQFRVGDRPLDAEVRIRRATGSYVWIHIRVIKFTNGVGGSTRAIGLIRDISAAKAAQRKLETSEERFRLLADNASDVIVLVDENQVFRYLSPSIQRVTGYFADELIGTDARDIAFSDDKSKLVPASNLRIAETLRREWRIRCKDGRLIWIESTGSVVGSLATAGGKMIVAVWRNITDRVEREAELAAARDSLKAQAEELAVERERAERASEAKSQFLAMMSHELRTPMTGVLGMADLLLLSGLDKQQKDLMNLLTRSAKSLMELLNDILDFSKIEAGQLEIETIPFRLSEVLDDVRSLFEPIASGKGLDLKTELPPTYLDVVIGDPKRLRQVLSNLVSNAIKFTEKGRIVIKLRQETISEGRVGLHFDVRDSGIGMALNDMQRLFQPFGQADVSTSRKYGGTGLGLAICRHLVNAMGGDIKVQSTPGEGSTFSFSVLVGHDRTARPRRVTAETAGLDLRKAAEAAPGRSVLVAEDNETSRYLILLMLGRLGHTVHVVNDGAQALAAAQEKPYDIIIMDMQMPVMDGADATRAIRALTTPVSKIPIIALTADVIGDHKGTYINAGVNVVVGKPVDWTILNAEIARLTAGSASGGATAETPKRPVKRVRTSEPTEALILDEIALKGLSDVLGESVLSTMLVSFNGNMIKYRDDLSAAVAGGDLKQAKRTAHALKGLCAQFGAMRASDLAKIIEVDATSLDDVRPVLPDLMECLADTEKALAARNAAKAASK